MLKRNILLLVAIIVIIVAAVKIAEFFKTNVVESDATKFVVEDLHSKYPNADVEIISVQESSNEKGEKFFEIKAKVTIDQNTPCPQRMHIFYYYPTQNFVPRQPEIITSNCKVCAEEVCVLVFPEEALIASHTFPGTEEVNRYVKEYPDAYGNAREITGGGWMVFWDSKSAPYYYSVTILKNNTVSSVKRIEK